jgi:hypothetical protein
VFLVIVRALNSLGYSFTGGGGAVPVDGTTIWKLDGPAGEVILRRDRSCILVGSVHAENSLKFVSLPAMLEAGVMSGNGSQLSASSQWSWLRFRRTNRGRLQRRASGYIACRTRHVEPRCSSPWPPGTLRASNGLRAYFGCTLGRLFTRGTRSRSSYPRAGHLRPPCREWMGIAGRSLNVIRPPAVHERTWAALNAQIEEAAAGLADGNMKLIACDPRDRRKRLHLKHELDRASRDHAVDRQVWAAIEVAIALIELLRVCPVCRTASDTHSFEHTNDLFRSQCSECGATWGRRTCRACDEPFPFLDYPGNSPSEDILGADRKYGADVLAIPLADHVYVCPNCGSRTDGGPPNWNTKSSTEVT